MIENTFKIIAAFVLGYLLGWILGGTLGAIHGSLPSLFFQVIVDSGTVSIMSLLLVLFIGATLGFLATKLGNKIFETSDKPFSGIALGMFLGLIVLFINGVLVPSNTAESRTSFNLLPMVYGSIVGGDIGTILFPLLGVIKVIREIIDSNNETRRNKDRLKEIEASLGINSSDEDKRA